MESSKDLILNPVFSLESPFCTGTRGISALNSEDFATLCDNGKYTFFSADANHNVSITSQFKAPFVSEQTGPSAIVPDEKGENCLLIDAAGKSVDLVQVNGNFRVFHWTVASMVTRAIWIEKSLFVLGFETGLLEVYQVGEKRPKKGFMCQSQTGKVSAIMDLVSIPNGRHELIGCGGSGEVFRINLEGEPREIWRTKFPSEFLMAVGVVPKSDKFIVSDKTLFLGEITTGLHVELPGGSPKMFTFSIWSMKFSGDGRFLLVLSGCEMVLVERKEGFMEATQMVHHKKAKAETFQAVEVFWEKGFGVLGDSAGTLFTFKI
jgi:hypothetical protein